MSSLPEEKLSFSDVFEKVNCVRDNDDLEWLRLIWYHSCNDRNNENQFSFSQWLAKTKIPFEFSYSFLLFNLPSKKKHFNLGNWRSQVAWLVFWTSSLLEQAGMSKTCGYSFIEIRNNQISRPTVVWAPLPSVRSNQPASFIFQERASQFTCFYQLSVSKW